MKRLDGLNAPAVRRPTATGIVHFGPGAFHRAHQADYIDRLLAGDPRWGIAAVSLRSPGTVLALAEQDGLYTLATLDAEPSFRILGAHNRSYRPGQDAHVRGLLADPAIAIVSSTVTEKGYCLGGDGTLDFGHPDVVHDLGNPDRPRSLIGWLALGLRDRRDAGLKPFTALCCDNMVSNGRKLGEAVTVFASRVDPELGAWIAGEARFPNAMVDSITPATDAGVRAMVAQAIGLDDAIPVTREAYTAWVIEDVLPAGAPDLAAAGAVLTRDVAAYELAKLRILNGAHSTLAYMGLLLGLETVADAMADPQLAGFAEALIERDIIPTLPTAFDLHAYGRDILARFRNPAIGHKLSQIAWDGSQKLPYRLLDTVRDALANGRPVARLVVPVAAWLGFVVRQARAGTAIVDPLAEELARIARSAASAEEFLALRQVFPAELAGDRRFVDALERAVSVIREHGPRPLLEDTHALA